MAHSPGALLGATAALRRLHTRACDKGKFSCWLGTSPSARWVWTAPSAWRGIVALGDYADSATRPLEYYFNRARVDRAGSALGRRGNTTARGWSDSSGCGSALPGSSSGGGSFRSSGDDITSAARGHCDTGYSVRAIRTRVRAIFLGGHGFPSRISASADLAVGQNKVERIIAPRGSGVRARGRKFCRPSDRCRAGLVRPAGEGSRLFVRLYGPLSSSVRASLFETISMCRRSRGCWGLARCRLASTEGLHSPHVSRKTRVSPRGLRHVALLPVDAFRCVCGRGAAMRAFHREEKSACGPGQQNQEQTTAPSAGCPLPHQVLPLLGRTGHDYVLVARAAVWRVLSRPLLSDITTALKAAAQELDAKREKRMP